MLCATDPSHAQAHHHARAVCVCVSVCVCVCYFFRNGGHTGRPHNNQTKWPGQPASTSHRSGAARPNGKPRHSTSEVPWFDSLGPSFCELCAFDFLILSARPVCMFCCVQTSKNELQGALYVCMRLSVAPETSICPFSIRYMIHNLIPCSTKLGVIRVMIRFGLFDLQSNSSLVKYYLLVPRVVWHYTIEGEAVKFKNATRRPFRVSFQCGAEWEMSVQCGKGCSGN
jgi:hypothetical protein